MQSDSWRARQNILALSQTEIMFVFAAIILILLQLKTRENEDLSDSNEKLMSAAQIQKEAPGSPPPDKADLFDEVKDTLVRSGELEAGDTEAASDLDARVVQAVREMALRAEKEEDPDAPLKDILTRAREANIVGNAGSEAEQLEELYRLAKVSKELEDEAAAKPKPQPPDNSNVAAAEEAPKAISDKVGFDPCWPKVDGDSYGYYLTFSTQYDHDTGKFRMKPAWNENVPQVRDAVKGDMSILARHPAGWMTREELSDYAREVRAKTREVYSSNCLLVTKINDAGRDAILFLSQFYYPVY